MCLLAKRGSTEQDVLNMVMNAGDHGVLQSELWKTITADSREGSRAIIRLERKRLIERRKELFDGRWTYRLFPKRQPASINSVVECPCLMCPNDSKCSAWGTVSPNGCERLTEWVLTLANAETNPSGDH